MHIEKRKKDGSVQYYLAHSYRKEGKARKVRVYLGANLSKKQLEEKRREAEEKIKEKIKTVKLIRDPYHTVLSSKELKELEKLGAGGKIKLLHLSEKDWLKFTEEFTYDTNAIEGSTINEKEVANILEKNKWPEKPKSEISETYGVADAVKYIRKNKEHLSLGLIRELHGIVFRNSKPFAGKFRKRTEEVVIMDAMGNVVHRGAPSGHVVSLLKELISWYGKNRKKYPPIVLAAVVHNQFENIHPFRDGNGRVGRLLLVNILIKHRMPPLNIEMKNRRRYYEALQEYQNNRNLRPMIELMLKEYKHLKMM